MHIRIGILGATPIAVDAVIRPARQLHHVEVYAVAARNPDRAMRYAARHGIAQVHSTYTDLLSDPQVEAVYVPLPNSLHAEWSVRALQAGKHVLCEKPLATNVRVAEDMVQVAAETGRVLLEAMHYRYHPLAARLKEILDNNEIGSVQHIETECSVPLLNPRSIQFRPELGGGATADVGCYTINLLRFLAGAEPQVTRAKATLLRPQLDRLMRADFEFPDGRTGRMTCALLSTRVLRLEAHVYGTEGELHVIFPFLPHIFNRITVVRGQHRRHEQIKGATTYTHQLIAFADTVRHGTPPLVDLNDALANMRLIDAVYMAAGLAVRGNES